REIVKNLVIARTTVLYGYSPGARPNFATWVIEKLKAGKKISIVDDQYGNPTLADDLAQACIVLCRPGISGVYNTVGASLLNRYEFALEIAKVFNLDKSLICKIKTESLNQKAARPLKGGLFTDKLFRDTGFRFLSAEQGLIKMKKQMEA
ncbi:dTDP-4-dehydrorhamnose reductase, partial [candidate division KSB1 bacterium]